MKANVKKNFQLYLVTSPLAKARVLSSFLFQALTKVFAGQPTCRCGIVIFCESCPASGHINLCLGPELPPDFHFLDVIQDWFKVLAVHVLLREGHWPGKKAQTQVLLTHRRSW